MPQQIPTTLFQELVKAKIITPEQGVNIQDITKKEGKDLGQVLIEQGIISDDNLVILKSKLYRLPVMHLADIELSHEALKDVSEDVVNFYKITPFGKENSVLRVGVLNPEDVEALEALKFVAADKGLTL